MEVNWDDDILNIWKNKSHNPVTTLISYNFDIDKTSQRRRRTSNFDFTRHSWNWDCWDRTGTTMAMAIGGAQQKHKFMQLWPFTSHKH